MSHKQEPKRKKEEGRKEEEEKLIRERRGGEFEQGQCEERTESCKKQLQTM